MQVSINIYTSDNNTNNNKLSQVTMNSVNDTISTLSVMI